MTEKNKKYTLNQLIKNSNEDKSLIIGALANKHLLSDYNLECESLKKGLNINAKYTEKEFEELIEKFKKKEV